MREGRLGYNCENGRYGLLSMDLWMDTGFHCGECMEVLVDDEWVCTRMEMNPAMEWYLVEHRIAEIWNMSVREYRSDLE